MPTAIKWYDTNAKDLADSYESVATPEVHGWLMDLLPSGRAVALDVGAGTGRDASWLTQQGFSVVAVEPSAGMRAEGRRLHPEAGIHWVDDALPEFRATERLGVSFDLILLSAVWMHVAPGDRPRAFRKLIALLKPGGMIAITLRLGPAENDRGIYPISEQEVERLAKAHGAFIERSQAKSDALGRPDVSWIQMAIRLPDDGTGALPLLRHIILNDDKSSTYKLALLRTLCRAADGAAGYAQYRENEFVGVPLGLVALYWIRLFKPLLAAGLPQSPANQGLDRLGFVKEGFRALMHPSTELSHLDLRAGMSFSGDRAKALHQALSDACRTIESMPAHYITYPDGTPILPIHRHGRVAQPSAITLDMPYLASFGELLVPRHLWQALQRFDVWIEPSLIAEWSRLVVRYGESQGRRIDEGDLAVAMQWSEPTRDVRIAREQALRLIEGPGLHCVWTGRALSTANLDVDHCLPWVAWPCSDLWNLMPAHRQVNQTHKRDRLPGNKVLLAAQDRIHEWWGHAYFSSQSSALPERFKMEARASLPLAGAEPFALADVFTGLTMQRLRLKHDQQIPEWLG